MAVPAESLQAVAHLRASAKCGGDQIPADESATAGKLKVQKIAALRQRKSSAHAASPSHIGRCHIDSQLERTDVRHENGRLKRLPDSPKSVLEGPIHVVDGEVTPDGYAVGSPQPPYQPSGKREIAPTPLGAHCQPKPVIGRLLSRCV